MSKTIKKDFFASLASGLGGAARRAAMMLLVAVLTMSAQTAWADSTFCGGNEGYSGEGRARDNSIWGDDWND